MKFLSLFLFLTVLPGWCLASFPVGVPSDVLRDYRAWLGDRDPYAVEFYGGAGARRDVVEVLLFLQALDRGCGQRSVTWVELDSYPRILASLLSGDILATGTTIWSEPFDEGLVALSPPTVPDGRFTALFYAREGRQQRLMHTRDLARFTVASSSAWERDWAALGRLPLKARLDAGSWSTMVKWVGSGRADLLLAPANAGEGSRLNVEGVPLVPMIGMRMLIPGSRHFGFHIHQFQGAKTSACFARGLYGMVESGLVDQAYREAGFWRADVADWPLVELAPLPKPEPDPDAPILLPW